MASHYPHKTIWVNHREVTLDAIRNQLEQPRDKFEEHTFAFIREWFSEASLFTLHTSGSTGSPKPILLTRNQLEASASFTLDALKIDAAKNSNALVCLDTRFIAGRMMLVRSFMAGLIIHAFTPTSKIIEVLANLRYELVAWVPMQVYEALKNPYAHRLNNIHHLLIGGAPLDPEAQIQLTGYTCKAYLTYGMTETISHVALRLIQNNSSQTFKALPKIQFEQDNRGCLVIHAPHLPDPIVTNDLVTLKSSTDFEWLGRWDNVINSGGIKIIPEIVEQKIADLLIQNDFRGAYFITGLPHPTKGQEVTLFLEGESRTPSEGIVKALQHTLEGYEIPRKIIGLASFVRTENGKVNRTETIKTYLNQH